ncbi:MAG: hypothetical protein C0443_04645 [Comamonadaceae bacterium]|nr:hypothetical protein [Comamonadaceae bacterium]
MFSRDTAYRKSGKGAEAITSRLHGLSPRLRSLLIVVDGKKTGQDLLKFAAHLGDADAMVTELIDGGFIEPVPGTDTVGTEPAEVGSVASPATATTPAEAAAHTRPSVTLPQAKRLATRLLIELMGPMADDACISIESAKNPDQFMSAVRKAHGLVRSFQGEGAASKFREEVEANFP